MIYLHKDTKRNSFPRPNSPIRKCHILRREDSSPKRDSNLHNSIGGRLGSRYTTSFLRLSFLQAINAVMIWSSLALQHRSSEGEKSGERKRPTLHPPRSGTMCVQPDKQWHCFEDNLVDTDESWSWKCVGLSERYDAILSGHWNWNCSD